MKKILLLIALLFICFLALSAQITQEQADEIVLERMSQEQMTYFLFAKEDVQENMTITTVRDEELELDYPCWVYYARYPYDSSYLIIKESNGNLLEVNVKRDTGPSDLTGWRAVKPTRATIVGQWKLVKVIFPDTSDGRVSYDYSQYAIMYEFKTDGVLTVSGEVGSIDSYYGHNIGEHDYLIVDDDKETGSYRLSIGKMTYWYTISANKLEISLAPLDGPIFYLEKVGEITSFIIGQWKLVEVSINKNSQYPSEIIDYSEKNISYDFQKDNKLIVTGSFSDDLLLLLFENFQEGEHFHEYSEIFACPLCLPGPNLRIDNPKTGKRSDYFCRFLDSETMTIVDVDTRVIDGNYFLWGKKFVKLK
jgi:hypothetical protein